MKIRVEIEPGDLVRQSQKNQKPISQKEAERLLRENEPFITRSLRNLRESLIESLFAERS